MATHSVKVSSRPLVNHFLLLLSSSRSSVKQQNNDEAGLPVDFEVLFKASLGDGDWEDS